MAPVGAHSYTGGSGRLELCVELEGGSKARIVVETPDSIDGRLKKQDKGYAFGAPVLFVERLEKEVVEKAVRAMARELSGYWLRFYDR